MYTQKEDRLRKLSGIIDALKKNKIIAFNHEDFEHRLLMQKYIFIYDKYIEPLGYIFDLYIYGPYSRELATDLEDVIRNKVEKEKIVLPESYIDFVRGKDLRYLDIATTFIDIKTSRKRYSDETPSKERICEHISGIKPYVQRDLIDKVANDVLLFEERIRKEIKKA